MTPTPRYSYHERDYAFGQAMLKLRTSIGLTQAALTDLVGVSRRVVGWAMAARQDETRVPQALAMAVTHRKPGAGLLHHSDQGCQ